MNIDCAYEKVAENEKVYSCAEFNKRDNCNRTEHCYSFFDKQQQAN